MKHPNESRDEATRSDKPVTGQPESPESRETFAKREQRPGEAGLANEARPGLGTRAEEERIRNDPGVVPKSTRAPRHDPSKPKATRYGYDEPRPEPREQLPDSLAHEEERSTGVSGHMGNT